MTTLRLFFWLERDADPETRTVTVDRVALARALRVSVPRIDRSLQVLQTVGALTPAPGPGCFIVHRTPPAPVAH